MAKKSLPGVNPVKDAIKPKSDDDAALASMVSKLSVKPNPATSPIKSPQKTTHILTYSKSNVPTRNALLQCFRYVRVKTRSTSNVAPRGWKYISQTTSHQVYHIPANTSIKEALGLISNSWKGVSSAEFSNDEAKEYIIFNDFKTYISV